MQFSTYFRISILLLLASCLGSVKTHGQTSILSSGGNATGSGGSISYSVGQIINSTIAGPDGSISNSVQQPYEISVITSIENHGSINSDFKLYPNPTGGLITLTIDPFDNDMNIRFLLYNLEGILLVDRMVEDEITDIRLDNYSYMIYFLVVIKDNMEVQTFKIIKR